MRFPILTPGARRVAIVLALSTLAAAPWAGAATVADPVRIGTSSAQNPTLGIPRWKGWVDPADPARIWATFANASSSGNNLVLSQDGGRTWSTGVVNPSQNGNLDYHLSLAGRGSDLFMTFPANEGIQVRTMPAPAADAGDLGNLATLPATTPFHRSSVMVDGSGRVWAFTRRGDVLSENVRYHWSDDAGATWTSGMAVATGTADVRIGSMPYVDGRACLVVLHLNSPRGYEYYLWDGNAFVAEPDHVISQVSAGYSRAFAHNVTGGRTFHLVYSLAGELHHAWKDFNGGTGAWNRQVLDSQPAMDDMEWAPSLTARGEELYLFYSRWVGSAADAQVYVRRWTPSSPGWEPADLVSTGGLTHNVNPNTSFSVPLSAGEIPVFWTAGSAGDGIWFNRVTAGEPQFDTSPPAAVQDLKAAPASAAEPVEVTWTAPGDDAVEGQAALYHLRYSRDPLTLYNWRTAIEVEGVPLPAPAGEPERVLIEGLEPGVTYYFGLLTRDEADNVSGLSNSAEVKVTGISGAGDVAAARPLLQANWPNPFNPTTVIPYSLPRAGTVRITVFDSAGRRVAGLLSEWRPAGDHEVRWDGRADNGRAAASGTYYCRLEFDGLASTRPMTLVR